MAAKDTRCYFHANMILFFYEETKFRLSKPKEKKGQIKSLLADNSKQSGDINFIFCSDEYLLRINREFLNHDYYTDVITFNTVECENGKKISGDIFISIESVNANAEFYKVSFDEELARVMAHGILHLIGYDDCDEDSKMVMRGKEDSFLKMIGLLND